MGVELRRLNQGELTLWITKPNLADTIFTKPNIKMCLERRQELRRTTERKPRKLLRPRLPRKITTTCKINLNKFWEVVEEEQQNNENAEREKLKMEVKLPSGRLDRYVFLLPILPLASPSPASFTPPSLSPPLPSLTSASPQSLILPSSSSLLE